MVYVPPRGLDSLHDNGSQDTGDSSSLPDSITAKLQRMTLAPHTEASTSALVTRSPPENSSYIHAAATDLEVQGQQQQRLRPRPNLKPIKVYAAPSSHSAVQTFDSATTLATGSGSLPRSKRYQQKRQETLAVAASAMATAPVMPVIVVTPTSDSYPSPLESPSSSITPPSVRNEPHHHRSAHRPLQLPSALKSTDSTTSQKSLRFALPPCTPSPAVLYPKTPFLLAAPEFGPESPTDMRRMSESTFTVGSSSARKRHMGDDEGEGNNDNHRDINESSVNGKQHTRNDDDLFAPLPPYPLYDNGGSYETDYSSTTNTTHENSMQSQPLLYSNSEPYASPGQCSPRTPYVFNTACEAARSAPEESPRTCLQRFQFPASSDAVLAPIVQVPDTNTLPAATMALEVASSMAHAPSITSPVFDPPYPLVDGMPDEALCAGSPSFCLPAQQQHINFGIALPNEVIQQQKPTLDAEHAYLVRQLDSLDEEKAEVSRRLSAAERKWNAAPSTIGSSTKASSTNDSSASATASSNDPPRGRTLERITVNTTSRRRLRREIGWLKYRRAEARRQENALLQRLNDVFDEGRQLRRASAAAAQMSNPMYTSQLTTAPLLTYSSQPPQQQQQVVHHALPSNPAATASNTNTTLPPPITFGGYGFSGALPPPSAVRFSFAGPAYPLPPNPFAAADIRVLEDQAYAAATQGARNWSMAFGTEAESKCESEVDGMWRAKRVKLGLWSGM